MLRPLLIIGTRPEAIKMAPVFWECGRRPAEVLPTVCTTGQHGELLDQAISDLALDVDFRLDLMRPNQTLAGLTARCIEGIDQLLEKRSFDCVVAQGDTTTVMAASIAAYYRRVPFVHVEAGLRTGNLFSPWPEELNRRVADTVSTLLCAPTQRAADALVREGASADSVYITGNTVVDTLVHILNRHRANPIDVGDRYAMLADRDMILITGHRRESFGDGLQNVCHAIIRLAEQMPDVSFVYPVHLNPNVQDTTGRLLSGRSNVHPINPVPYPEFVWLMNRSRLIVTDSGGIQEEAPTLGKPVLITRPTTERPEAIEAGVARLVGTSVESIVTEVTRLMSDGNAYSASQAKPNPFGDGHAAERIVDLILNLDS